MLESFLDDHEVRTLGLNRRSGRVSSLAKHSTKHITFGWFLYLRLSFMVLLIVQIWSVVFISIDGFFGDHDASYNTAWGAIIKDSFRHKSQYLTNAVLRKIDFSERLNNMFKKTNVIQLAAKNLRRFVSHDDDIVYLIPTSDYGPIASLGDGTWAVVDDPTYECATKGFLVDMVLSKRRHRMELEPNFRPLCLERADSDKAHSVDHEHRLVTPYQSLSYSKEDWAMNGNTKCIILLWPLITVLMDFVSSNYLKKPKSKWTNGRNWLLYTLLWGMLSKAFLLLETWTLFRVARLFYLAGLNVSLLVSLSIGVVSNVILALKLDYIPCVTILFSPIDTTKLERPLSSRSNKMFSQRLNVFSLRFSLFTVMYFMFTKHLTILRGSIKYVLQVRDHLIRGPKIELVHKNERRVGHDDIGGLGIPSVAGEAHDAHNDTVVKMQELMSKTVSFDKQMTVLRGIGLVGLPTVSRCLSVRFGGNSSLEHHYFHDWVNNFRWLWAAVFPSFLLKIYLCNNLSKDTSLLLVGNTIVSSLVLTVGVAYLVFDKKLLRSWLLD